MSHTGPTPQLTDLTDKTCPFKEHANNQTRRGPSGQEASDPWDAMTLAQVLGSRR